MSSQQNPEEMIRSLAKGNRKLEKKLKRTQEALVYSQEGRELYQSIANRLNQELQAKNEELESTLDKLQAANLSIEQARRAAEKANRHKSEFIAKVSHELRTPLNGILGMNQLLLEKEHDQKTRVQLQIVNDSAETLAILVEDILDFSALETDRYKASPRVFIPYQLVDGIAISMEPRIHTKGLLLVVENSIDPSVQLVGPSTRISQVLFNLLSNAIKFTEHGQIVVRAAIQHVAEKDQMLCLEVEDSGVGIEESQQALIFEMFRQVDTSSSGRGEGLGLGLAISKQVMQALGGSIEVKSQLGVGSCFSVKVPCLLSIEQHLDVSEAQNEGLGSLNFLLVEDMLINQRVAVDILESYGQRVMSVDNGSAAIEAVKQHDFDAVLMDIRLPGIDGYEATTQIRALDDSKKASIPIYAFTANQAEIDKYDDGTTRGFDGVLAKPIRIEKLKALISGIQEPASLDRELPEAKKKPSDELLSFSFIEKELQQLGETSVLELIALFRETADGILSQLEQEAVNTNPEKIQDHSHNLASAAYDVGLNALGNKAKTIESLIQSGKTSDAIKQLTELRYLYDSSLDELNSYLNENQISF